jgi:AcrR family transcriptional regulator
MPATPTTRKGLHTHQRILDAARTVFARDGYVEARMVDIAEAAGLSTGGLYRYFEDKTDVFAALVANLHEELYQASGHTNRPFGTDPLGALTDANRGYIEHYYENRDVMRVLVEAAGVDERFRSIWWEMRNRHINRFAKAFRSVYGVEQVQGVPIEVVTEAMACLVEQCCYVWYAHEGMTGATAAPVSLDTAVEVVSNAWFQTCFGEAPRVQDPGLAALPSDKP